MHVSAYMYVCVCIYIYAYVCICVNVKTCICVYVDVCMLCYVCVWKGLMLKFGHVICAHLQTYLLTDFFPAQNPNHPAPILLMIELQAFHF